MTAQSPTVADKPSFKDLQYRFTAHIRDPQNNPAPEGIEDRRLAIYRDETLPIVTYYERQGLLRVIDGMGTEEEVFERILTSIGMEKCG